MHSADKGEKEEKAVVEPPREEEPKEPEAHGEGHAEAHGEAHGEGHGGHGEEAKSLNSVQVRH